MFPGEELSHRSSRPDEYNISVQDVESIVGKARAPPARTKLGGCILNAYPNRREYTRTFHAG